MIKENYSGEAIDQLIQFFKLNIKGVLHVGAHKCEEQNVYLKYTSNKNIYWIEKQNLKYFNVSTKNNININEVFNYLYTMLNTN